jgi:FtsP/CotA-like multicopper oxidase with cupredoxin domain
VGESHPIHLHGYDFYIVGLGFGNYNPQIDPQKFNLVDPPMHNTVNVPINGWDAIRFVAENPGKHKVTHHSAFLHHCPLFLNGLMSVMVIMYGRSLADALPLGRAHNMGVGDDFCG